MNKDEESATFISDIIDIEAGIKGIYQRNKMKKNT